MSEWASNDGITATGFEAAAGWSTIGYEPNARKNRCIAKDHTCKGFRIGGSKYCAGHDKAMRSVKAKAEAQREAIRHQQATAAAERRFDENMAIARSRMWGDK
jgi:hypothetical protein